MATLIAPFTMVVTGSTGCGKTRFIKRLIDEQKDLLQRPFSGVYYFYAEWQPIFAEMEKNGVIFERGAPTSDSLDKIGSNGLVVVDDMMATLCRSKELVELFTVKSHHRGISVIFTSHSFYYDTKEIRCVTRNAHYLVLMKSPRMDSTVEKLGSQLFPRRRNRGFHRF